jgi:glucan phosphoethanolaminetransferase (alkaline phosphatase superfamily)
MKRDTQIILKKSLIYASVLAAFSFIMASSLAGKGWKGAFLIYMLVFSLIFFLISGLLLAIFSDAGPSLPNAGGYIQNAYLPSQEFTRSMEEYI